MRSDDNLSDGTRDGVRGQGSEGGLHEIHGMVKIAAAEKRHGRMDEPAGDADGERRDAGPGQVDRAGIGTAEAGLLDLGRDAVFPCGLRD